MFKLTEWQLIHIPFVQALTAKLLSNNCWTCDMTVYPEGSDFQIHDKLSYLLN